ncbi:MAG: hypothetical protein ABEK17_02430 [Candidatus Aenigmatarchaeota archaeon]
MPSNTVKINNFHALEWEVYDSKMELLIQFLDVIGERTLVDVDPRDVRQCQNQ